MLKEWFVSHFGGMERREVWGYVVWLTFAVVVLVPELWAAFWKDSAGWPTISATTGELEFEHPVVALGVVGVIVLCAYSAFRYPPDRTGVLPVKDAPPALAGGVQGDPVLPYRTPLGGRLTRSTTPVREIGTVVYFAGALVVIVVGTSIAIATSDVDEEFAVGRTLYGLMALFWVVVPTALAWPKRLAVDVPFPTMFATVRSLERRFRALALVVAAGLCMLLIHLVLYPWPSIIPDLRRLHHDYACQPLPPAKPKMQADCRRPDEADVRPSPVDP